MRISYGNNLQYYFDIDIDDNLIKQVRLLNSRGVDVSLGEGKPDFVYSVWLKEDENKTLK